MYRYHNGSVNTITETPNGDGEYLFVNAAKTQLTLHVMKFSTYGIAYTNYTYSSNASYYSIASTATTGGTITASSSGTVTSGGSRTYTITPDEGYKISDVLVDGVSVGAVSTYTFADVTSAHTIKAIFVKASDIWDNPYSDITDTDWYYDAIRFVTESGLMNGIGTDTFGPGLSTSRGMIITILYRLEGEPSTALVYTFKDVASGKYYADAVAWGATAGIIEGYDADTYGPNINITREQLSAIIHRYAQYKEYDVVDSDDLSSFPDASSVSSWALADVQWAAGAGIMSGTDTGALAPRSESTRAQAAVMLMRFMQEFI